MQIDGLSARFGTALGKGLEAKDALWAGLTDSYVKVLRVIHGFFKRTPIMISFLIAVFPLPLLLLLLLPPAVAHGHHR
jgi:hypothetical protein